VLSTPSQRSARVRQLSLRQEYEEYVLQRIEEYKDHLTRAQLLQIADEAVREIEIEAEEQLVLTEVLVLEHVDRLIKRRLRLPAFRRWRDGYLRLRTSQWDPLHWGLGAQTPLVDLAQRLEDSDLALVLGGGALSAGLFLAACDWPVLLIDQHLEIVEDAEARAAHEVLSHRFRALVTSFGGWFPDAAPTLAVIDPVALTAVDALIRDRVLEALKRRTRSGGAHVVLPNKPPDASISLVREALLVSYADWGAHHQHCERAPGWFVAFKP